MRMTTLCAALVIGASTHVAAQSAPRTPATDRALSDTAKIGTYDLELTSDDGTIIGSLVIKRSKDGLAAEIDAGGRHPEPKSFIHQGAEYIFTGGHGTFTVTYHFKFAGNAVTGSYALSSGQSGAVTGTYKP